MNKIRYYSWLFLDNKYLRLLYRLDYFNIIKKNNNKYLIKLIKSFNNFKKEKNLTFLDKIESDIEKINLQPDQKYFQKIFNGIDIKITNSILHQLINKYLSKKFGLFSISRSILISKYNNSNLI